MERGSGATVFAGRVGDAVSVDFDGYGSYVHGTGVVSDRVPTRFPFWFVTSGRRCVPPHPPVAGL